MGSGQGKTEKRVVAFRLKFSDTRLPQQINIARLPAQANSSLFSMRSIRALILSVRTL